MFLFKNFVIIIICVLYACNKAFFELFQRKALYKYLLLIITFLYYDSRLKPFSNISTVIIQITFLAYIACKRTSREKQQFDNTPTWSN